MVSRGEEILDSVPIDLFLEIFSRLPAKIIARFRSLSKLWRSMLHRPYLLKRSWARPRLLVILEGYLAWSFFSSLQPQNPYGKSSSYADFHMKFFAYMPSRPRRFCGFTSGLMYFPSMRISENKGEVGVPVIVNPITGQCASLPELPSYEEPTSYLGFDPIDKQFKLLSIGDPYYAFSDPKIMTVGTGEMSWRSIQCPFTHDPSSKGICINGVLYYLATFYRTSNDEAFNVKALSFVIVCFDVRSEKFKFIEPEESFLYARLINYKGKLCGIEWKYDRDVKTRELSLRVLEDAGET